jgi:hypothetical protein
MNDAKFLHSDSWLLIAVIYASQDASVATLTEIIAAADYINHAIMTRGELETGFARLIRAGYVKQTDGGFATSDAVQSFWQTTGSTQRQALKAWDAVATFIGAPAWAPGPLPESTEERYVSSTDYEAAVEAYQQRMEPKKKPKEK